MLPNTSNIKLKTLSARKIFTQWISPFEIVKRICIVAYRLKLPKTIGIYNVFLVCLL